jgi:hypothetical protein
MNDDELNVAWGIVVKVKNHVRVKEGTWKGIQARYGQVRSMVARSDSAWWDSCC